MKNETVFRDKAIERISSPDQLNEYVKLTNPGIWFVLFSVLVILVGGCIFGVSGHIDSTVPGVAISNDGKLKCLVKTEYEDRFNDKMRIKVEGKEFGVHFDNLKPTSLVDDTDSYALFLGDMKAGEWVYEIEADGALPDGVYKAKVVMERISPLVFLFGKQ